MAIDTYQPSIEDESVSPKARRIAGLFWRAKLHDYVTKK
jgi:hypothetical protein